MTAKPEVIAAALDQVEQGFAVFALGRNSKKPVTDHGFKNATTNPDWVRTQLAAPSAGNYGMTWPEDSPHPVVTLDLDNGEEGLERPWQDRLLELMDRLGQLPPTKSTTTPSGGRHAFYRWPKDRRIPPGDELFGFTVRWPGRGYLVGPGSSINGREYVAGPSAAIADLPVDWVEAALVGRRNRYDSESALIVVAGGFELPDSIPAGRRYPTMRDYIASRYNSGLNADELWALVRDRVAPLFTVPKSEADLRGDFDRAIAKISKRLGPPRKGGMSPTDAVAAVTPIPVSNLAEIPVEAVVWLWHRYLPIGSVALFDGNPGEGKSTIVADIIARLTLGTDWPDGTPVGNPGSVLYVTKEDDASTQVRPRLEASGGDPRRVNFVAADLLFPRDLGRFEELLTELRPRLVLLDPLMSYLEGKVKVISDNEVRSALMTPLGEIAREVGCALLVIRHFNKVSGQSALLRGAGSLGGLAGAARMVLAIAPDPESDDDTARVFGVVKSNYEAKPPSLRVRIAAAPVEGFAMTVSRATWDGFSDTAVGDLMERTREEHQLVLEAEEALREVLAAGGEPMPATDVHAAMKAKKHSRGSMYNAAKALHVVVERVGFPGRTVWSLPRFVISGLSGSSHPDSETTETTAVERSRQGGSEPPNHRTTGTTAGPQQSSHSSHSYQSYVGGTRTPAPAREDESPVTVVPATAAWVVPCLDYPGHQASHRRTVAGWICAICNPELAP